jgi:hypothetical protein
MEPLRVCRGRPEVTDSHYLNDEQDPDPDPHLGEAADTGKKRIAGVADTRDLFIAGVKVSCHFQKFKKNLIG